MLIIPEIETVVILTPRTGSGTLRRAVAAKYPRAMLVYRHMEADGVPQGYDRWRKIGVVREPTERLWSLYKYLARFDKIFEMKGRNEEPAYIKSIMDSVRDISFNNWILYNQTVFTSPYDRTGGNKFYPEYTVRHPLPENRKSQFVYLRPDLGTHIYKYTQLDKLAADLGLDMSRRQNQTEPEPMPRISLAARAQILRTFAWDIEASRDTKQIPQAAE